jgi:LysR family transcriptional regulator, glycine cleavage system transcriptional activator
MDKLRRNLPSPTGLVTFEAAARHLNFTRAAEELGVSQAAVSRQVKALEANLGVSLFLRAARRVQLTGHGRQLYDAVSVGLGHIAEVAGDLRRQGDDTGVAVAASTAFTSMWLMSRVGAFRARHPEIALRLVAVDPYVDPTGAGVDLAMRYGDGDWPGLDTARLFDDLVMPVASPGYLSGRPPLAGPADLASHTLLHQDEIEPNWVSWRDWLANFGIAPPAARGGVSFNSYANVIQAALDGAGIAIGWARLVDGPLRRGALVRPIPDYVRSAQAHHVIVPRTRPLGPEAALFRDWLIATAAAEPDPEDDLPPVYDG